MLFRFLPAVVADRLEVCQPQESDAEVYAWHEGCSVRVPVRFTSSPSEARRSPCGPPAWPGGSGR